MRVANRSFVFGCALVFFAGADLHAGKLKPKKTAADLRAEYLANIAGASVATSKQRTTGSLWAPDGPLNDVSGDYTAHGLNDLVTVIASVQTTASQSGTVASARDFQTASALTGIFGSAPQATNPLIAGNSSTSLKGSGATASNTAFSTSLAGQVIAVMPNGNLVIEAQSTIDMNNQHEQVIVRGIARQGDISPANTIPSTALSSLQIELKGKGIISSSVRPPNPITRAVLWLFGF
jgi:flagellar L-ring protein precursor FlgH